MLLGVETLALTLRFDGEALSDQQGWVADLVGRSCWLSSLGVCVGTFIGLVVLSTMCEDRRSRQPSKTIDRGRRVWLYLLGHLGAYGCLAWLTGSIFEGGALSTNPLPWVSAWLAAGAATVILWLLVALPVPDWKRLARDHWWVVLFASMAGIVALVLGRWTSSLWEMFHGSTLRAVQWLLSLCYSDLVCRPAEFILGTRGFQVEISSQCSGFEGIGLIWAFLAVCFWWFRHDLRFPQAFLLIPLGTALSWIFNVLRIAALIALGDHGWQKLAVGGFHSQAGWLAFNGIALGLIWLSRRIRLFSRVSAAAANEPAATANPTAAYVAPLLVIALVTMLTGALSHGGVDRFYAARVLAAAVVLWSFRHEYIALRSRCSWHAVVVGLAVYVIWTALEPAVPSSEARTAVSDALSQMPRAWAWAWLAARSIGSVIVIPLAEELAFRGYLTRRLIAADFQTVPEGRFTWPSFLVSSLLFGLLHQRWLAGTIAGMAYALVYYRRGRLIDAVTAHAVTNLAITISVFLTGEWFRWS